MSKKPTTNKPARQCHLQWVKADDINVNPVAQREFRPTWAHAILEQFDLDKFQVPHVNRRANGSLYVMEGQHSLWAYRQWVGEGQQVQVWLYDGLTEQEEAEFFLSLALLTIYQRFGPKVLGQTLRTIRQSFVDGGFERPVLLGIAMVLARYGESIDTDRLIGKLAGIRNGWKGLVQRTNNIKAAQGVSQTEAAAAAVVEFYNQGRGGVKLMSWWAA